MKNRAHVCSTTILLLVAAAAAPAQEEPQGPPRAQGRGNMGRPIVLGPDDVRAFPDAPPGFNTRRAGVPAGRIEPFEYDSRVTGTRRRANVYLPPGYSSDRKYPVLYPRLTPRFDRILNEAPPETPTSGAKTTPTNSWNIARTPAPVLPRRTR